MKTIRTAAALVIAMALSPTMNAVAATDYAKCTAARLKAGAKYGSCMNKAYAKSVTGDDFQLYIPAGSKCRVKYIATWAKLQAKFAGTGTTCELARFASTATTVTDNLTGLTWEKKTSYNSLVNLADPHDADNRYSWSAVVPSPDGTVFTSFLASLNSGGCFAGACDWRLPTSGELNTLFAAAYGEPCVSPCIDAVFTPTATPETYWGGNDAPYTSFFAWDASFTVSTTGYSTKDDTHHVRAVRGGL